MNWFYYGYSTSQGWTVSGPAAARGSSELERIFVGGGVFGSLEASSWAIGVQEISPTSLALWLRPGAKSAWGVVCPRYEYQGDPFALLERMAGLDYSGHPDLPPFPALAWDRRGACPAPRRVGALTKVLLEEVRDCWPRESGIAVPDFSAVPKGPLERLYPQVPLVLDPGLGDKVVQAPAPQARDLVLDEITKLGRRLGKVEERISAMGASLKDAQEIAVAVRAAVPALDTALRTELKSGLDLLRQDVARLAHVTPEASRPEPPPNARPDRFVRFCVAVLVLGFITMWFTANNPDSRISDELQVNAQVTNDLRAIVVAQKDVTDELASITSGISSLRIEFAELSSQSTQAIKNLDTRINTTLQLIAVYTSKLHTIIVAQKDVADGLASISNEVSSLRNEITELSILVYAMRSDVSRITNDVRVILGNRDNIPDRNRAGQSPAATGGEKL